MNLDEDFASVLVLAENTDLAEAPSKKHRPAAFPFCFGDLLGRVIDPFGTPLDGKPLTITKWHRHGAGTDRPP